MRSLLDSARTIRGPKFSATRTAVFGRGSGRVVTVDKSPATRVDSLVMDEF